MKVLWFVHKHFIWLMPLIVFVATVLSKLSYTTLSSSFDAYYHHAHSLAYTSNEQFAYPVFSLINTYQTDLWFLYHVVLGWFIYALKILNIDPIVANKVFHAALGTGVFVMIFLTARAIAQSLEGWHRSFAHVVPYSHPLQAHSIGILAVGFLLLAPLHNMSFLYRTLSNERPHMIAIMIVLGICIALLHKQFKWIVFGASLAAFTYSFSLIILLPVAVFLGIWLLTHRHTNVDWQIPLIATGAAFAGLAIGILLHPNSYGYLISGIGQTAFAVGHSLFAWTGLFGPDNILPPAEMRFMPNEISISLGTIIVLLLGIAYLWVIWVRRRTFLFTLPVLVFCTALVIGLCFTLLTIIIPRTVEYGLPFLAVTLAVIVGQLVWPVLHGSHQKIMCRVGEIGDTYRRATVAVADVFSDVRLRQGLILISTVVVLGAPFATTFSLTRTRGSFDDTQYYGVAEYMSNITNHVLLTENFHEYPLLIYSNPTIHVSSGFDSRFVHLYDAQLGNAIMTFWGHTIACQLDECEEPPGIIPPLFAQHGITHLLVNEDNVAEPDIVTNLQSSSDVRLVYRDVHYPNITLYEISL